MNSNNYKPIFDIKKKVFLDALVDDYCGLSLYFSDDPKKEKFKIFFDSYISYRNSDESERFYSIKEVIKNSFPFRFFELYNSDYIDWIVNESKGTRSNEKLRHFLFVTDNDIIEVLSLSRPDFIRLALNDKIIVKTE